MNTNKLLEQLANAQDAQADLALLCGALAIDSVTGQETPFAYFLKDQLSELGFKAETGVFEAERENVWGVSPFAGPNLMVLGHTDTVHVRGWKEYWQNDPRNEPFVGAEVDGQIWSRGASDLKGGICAAIAGYRLLQQIEVQPTCNLTFAFIGDEESGEPGSGVSAGAKDLVRRVESSQIPRPDFAIYVEPTKLDIYTAQIGFFIAEITVTGKTAYFGTPELGVDALKATHKLLSQIWAHEADLNAGPSHDLLGTSSILVTDVNGGGFIAVPGECKFSLIRKLRPGENLDEAVKAFEGALNPQNLSDGINVTIDYTAGRDHPKGGSPVENDPTLAAIHLLQSCIQKTRANAGEIAAAPYWSEMPFLTDLIGCPTVYCAPGDISVAHTFEERIEIEEYLAAVRTFALFFAGFNTSHSPQKSLI
ncbi:MAG: M20/M25/M40 family metallo-hydrolase [Aestuariivita sp.]|nr:M20/M25/M40 family metallo-hydrolase [Aestuariivita sp.]MCY4203822.1 M20/M25/M40 family metallo-hydrolase [Aestuariivita sp.]MCY4288437.1 M20/M25/M40 family metallo-hydrolase [Aestuariivita sp.]